MASIYRIATGWRVQIRMHGTATSKVLPSKAAAMAWAREQETLISKSRSGDPYMRFGELLAHYLANARPGGRTKQACLRGLERYWKDWRLVEIGSDAVTRYAMKRQREGQGPSTVLQELAYLSTVLKHGGVMVGSDEALLAQQKVSSTITTLRHIGVAGESQKRNRRPTDEEPQKLAEWFAERQRSTVPVMDIVLWALCTCCRLGEIVGVAGVLWEDIDQERRTALLRGRKDPRVAGGRDDVIPLLVGPVRFAGRVVDPLEILRRQQSAYLGRGRVFPYAKNTIESAFARGCLECHIEDLRFHDLRHDGISRLFEAGYGIPQVAAVSGHRSWKNLKRYTHITPESLQRS